jgi:hypothetical protein
MGQPFIKAIWAGMLLSLPCAAAAETVAQALPGQLVGVEIRSDAGETLGVIDRVAETGGAAAQVVVAVAGGDRKLIAIPLSQLRFEKRPGPVDVTVGYGVLGTAAPGVTGPFGVAHLAATDAAMQVQPEGGPPGTIIMLPGGTIQSLRAMPDAK